MDIVKERRPLGGTATSRRKQNSDHTDSFTKKNKERGADESGVRISHY